VKIVCLMPTYGRRRELLNNSLACFFAQSHTEKQLFIFDDLGTLADVEIAHPYRSQIWIMSTHDRAPSVGEKYNMMMRTLNASDLAYDAVAVWDDDDVYLPDYLATHAEILASHPWSKPSSIVSAYFQPPMIEPAHGRFHGSIAISSTSLLHSCGCQVRSGGRSPMSPASQSASSCGRWRA
jgi:hypothetical protein